MALNRKSMKYQTVTMTISKKCSVIQFAIGVYAFFQFNLLFNKLAHQWCSTSSAFLHRRSILWTLMINGTLTISLRKQLWREERCSLSEIYCKCHWMLACLMHTKLMSGWCSNYPAHCLSFHSWNPPIVRHNIKTVAC